MVVRFRALDSPLAFGERLAVLRRRSALSQTEVARRLGVRRATVNDWEAERAEPRLSHAVALAALYGVTIDVLTGQAPLPSR